MSKLLLILFLIVVLMLPIGFLWSLAALFKAKQRNMLVATAGFAVSTMGIFLLYGVFKAFGAAWGGGSVASPLAYAFSGFGLGLVFSAMVLLVRTGMMK